ncbi:DUF1570 domain-containing protein [Croceibacterium sp. TMG7-5b_MA50]|uniref:DUF1570 domain-containing protein n=1 Tax=Croceibacterium sp. TMG7-5b_MA50 TaxID=3121290 RepID=UPI0032213F8C
MMRWVGLFLLAVILPGSAAEARWLEAASDHFVIYADTREATLREFSEELELYHSAMERITGTQMGTPSPSARVTIYVVGDQREVRRINGDGNPFVAGFYIPRAAGSLAFVPRIVNRGSTTDFSQIVLLHEYAHHFMISSGLQAMPRWLSEGSAEFYASTKFKQDGTVLLGGPASHRAGELFYSADVPLEQLFDDKLYWEERGRSHDAYYGRAWLLYHYLIFNDGRQGQLGQYWELLTKGTPSPEAGRQAFGDLAVLQREVDNYLKGRRMNQLEIGSLAGSPIAIRALTAGEAAVVPLRMVSKRGVNREQALELLPDYRRLAGEHAGDGAVLAALAEAEYDAGNDAEAIAAADRALALDPTQVNAYVQKGYALFRQAGEAEDEAAAFTAAMAPLRALNARENDHPLPLIYYYRSFLERGEEPNALAVQALERALELAPYDQSLRMMVVLQQASEGRMEQARLSVQPLAYDPHGGGRAEAAARLLAFLQAQPEGTTMSIADAAANLYERPVGQADGGGEPVASD